MIISLKLNASAYGAKKQVASVILRDVVQDLHTCLALVDLDSEIFIRHHVKDTMSHLSSTLEDQFFQVSETVHALIKEANPTAVASLQAAPEDDRLTCP